MTEQDYINVRDLSNVIHAKAMLNDVTIENQPNIDRKEFEKVMRRLTEWEEKLFAIIQSE